MNEKLVDILFNQINRRFQCEKICGHAFKMDDFKWFVKEGVIIRSDRTYLLDICKTKIFLFVFKGGIEVEPILLINIADLNINNIIFDVGFILGNEIING